MTNIDSVPDQELARSLKLRATKLSAQAQRLRVAAAALTGDEPPKENAAAGGMAGMSDEAVALRGELGRLRQENTDLRNKLQTALQQYGVLKEQKEKVAKELRDWIKEAEDRLQAIDAKEGRIKFLEAKLAERTEEVAKLESLLEEVTEPEAPYNNGAEEPPKEPVVESTRRAHNAVTSVEAVRDIVVKEFKKADRFTRMDVAKALGVGDSTVGPYLQKLLDMGMIEKVGTVGRGAGYKYVDPRSESGPTSRPRGEEQVDGVGADAAQRGREVPHTSPKGMSGKRSQDSKLLAQGRKLKAGGNAKKR